MADNIEIIYDKNNFFKSFLEKIKKLREKNNFIKKTVSNGYLWDLTENNLIGQKI